MSDTKKPNPFAKFSSSENEVANPSSEKATPSSVELPTATEANAPAPSGEPRKNPFLAFDTSEMEDRDAASLRQAMIAGTVFGGYKGAKAGLNERENVGILKDRGSQGYLSGMLPPDTRLTLKSLQDLTGMPVRTQSEIQAALARLQATPTVREERIKTTPTGQRVRVGYTTTPAREHVDLSKFEIPSVNKAAASGAARGAVAGVTAGPALYQAATQEGPTDWTQWASIAGALPTVMPKLASKIPGLNAVAPYLGIPYAIKHKEELMNAMRMNDINPTAFPAGAIGSEESPLNMPTR